MAKGTRNTVVVGASVAGLFAAYRLAREGVPVQVYEAGADFTFDARTLIVTPAWLRLLDFDPGDAVLNRTRAFELISQGASVRVPLREPDVIVERSRFMRLLSRRVQDAGGRLTLGHRLEGMIKQAPFPLLRFRNGAAGERRHASSVLGADGVHSAVGQAIERDGLERVAIRQARVPLPSDLPPDTVRVWFDRDSTRFFYWLIPESPRAAVAGLIADTPEQASQGLQRFLGAHDLFPSEYQAACVPLHAFRFQPSLTVGRGRVLLVGDAAGQVKVTTVGGVVAGMRGAAAAVRALLRGTPYIAELRPLRRELNFHRLVRHLLDGFTNEDYDQLLQLLNRRARGVLSRYNRDQLAHGIWRLLPAQPRWFLLGARALVRRFAGR